MFSCARVCARGLVLSVLEGQIAWTWTWAWSIRCLSWALSSAAAALTEAAVSLAFFSRLSSWVEKSRVFSFACGVQTCVAVLLSL
jgi:hypothetical protein